MSCNLAVDSEPDYWIRSRSHRRKTCGSGSATLKISCVLVEIKRMSGSVRGQPWSGAASLDRYIINHKYLRWTGYSKFLQKDSGIFLPRNSSYESEAGYNYLASYISRHKTLGMDRSSGVFIKISGNVFEHTGSIRQYIFKQPYNQP